MLKHTKHVPYMSARVSGQETGENCFTKINISADSILLISIGIS